MTNVLISDVHARIVACATHTRNLTQTLTVFSLSGDCIAKIQTSYKLVCACLSFGTEFLLTGDSSGRIHVCSVGDLSEVMAYTPAPSSEGALLALLSPEGGRHLICATDINQLMVCMCVCVCMCV